MENQMDKATPRKTINSLIKAGYSRKLATAIATRLTRKRMSQIRDFCDTRKNEIKGDL